jgi:hypothetical protein
MPRLGYAQYRVYDIEEKNKHSASKTVLTSNYGLVGTGKSSYNATRQYNSGNWQQVLWAFVDELESRTEPAYEVKWLKSKQATLLRLQGHRVEEV